MSNRIIVKNGERYGRLTILSEATQRGKDRYFLCQCDCGVSKEVALKSLRSHVIVSCGCYSKDSASIVNLKHGLYKSRQYSIWLNMKARCGNPKSPKYHHYGGRGISICAEWLDFMTFYTWAMNNGYADHLSIDRINVNGNYEPSNCRWATNSQQRLNQR